MFPDEKAKKDKIQFSEENSAVADVIQKYQCNIPTQHH